MISPEIIKCYKKIHTLAGITCGIALFIAFYAGALTVFKESLILWNTSPVSLTPVSLDQTPTLIERVIAERPKSAKRFLIHLNSDNLMPYRMVWEECEDDADHDTSACRRYGATLDNNHLRIDELNASRVAEFIDVLHRVVGFPFDKDIFRRIMGVIALIYGVALISGVIVLIPSLVKNLFALRLGKSRRRAWLDSHNLIGIMSLPFHTIMVITAVVFAFHDDIYLLQDKIFYGGKLSGAFAAIVPQEDEKNLTTRDLSKMILPNDIIAKAKELSSTFEPSSLYYQNITKEKSVARVLGFDKTAVSPRAIGGFVAFDPYGGNLISADFLPGKQKPVFSAISSFFALHFGTFGGTYIRWMYFFLALAGAWVFYSGNLLWIERQSSRKAISAPQEPARSANLMGAATVGVCLGCVAGISLTIAFGKALSRYISDIVYLPQYIYYVVFLGCVFWAFYRGANKASGELLIITALFTLMILLVSLVGFLFPDTRWWANTDICSLSVDIVALIGSIVFAWIAYKVIHKTNKGET